MRVLRRVRPRQRQRPVRGRAPGGIIEVLRLFSVVFFAGLGFQVAHGLLGSRDGTLLGPFGGVTVGVVIGSGVGYVVGGVFGRTAAATADRTESALREVSADTLVAGGLGTVTGVLTGAGLGWPVFLVPQPLLAIPLFGVILALLGYLGFRVGAAKRDGVLAIFGGRTGVAPRREAASAVVKVVDTSVAIDARLLDVVRSGFLHGRMLVIQPVVDELQHLADSSDPLRRARGRRGLELLGALRREPAIDLEVVADAYPDVPDVDAKLVRCCLDGDLALLTLDTNLAKAAAVTGVRVLNLHSLSLALRPPVVVGEDVTVQLIKPGREPGQAVGYLDDGTMVVVEQARARVGADVTVRISSVVTTANGRLVFASVATPTGVAPTPRVAAASSGA
jgi:uncharacterized protein YacL